MNSLRALAVDSTGDVYVYEGPFDGSSRRVQKFDGEGSFLLMLGGEVNKGPGSPGNVCTATHVAAGDTCGGGVPGVLDGWFSNGDVGNFLDYNPVTDTIFVGDVNRVQEFSVSGGFEGKIALPGTTVSGLAADPIDGELVLLFAGQDDIHRLDPVTEDLVVSSLKVPSPTIVTVGPEGNVYASWDPPGLADRPEVIGFDPDRDPLPGMEAGEGFDATTDATVPRGLATNLCAGSQVPGNLFVARFFGSPSRSYIRLYGTPPVGCESPPARPPEITAQYAVAVDADRAVLRSQIDPHFWPDATYYVQYGIAPCSLGGCAEAPTPPGLGLTTRSVNAPVTSLPFALTGLAPDTTYHYRFVAQSGGGGPVSGEGGVPGDPGAEGTFDTFPLPTQRRPDLCVNTEFRIGPGALLADCRAYEMVSPVDKNANDILSSLVATSDEIPARLQQVSLSGDALTYSSSTAFQDAESAAFSSQYLAERRPRGHPQEGWSSEEISPRRSEKVTFKGLDTDFKAFSADLCTAWLRSTYDPPLDGQAVPLYPNIYRRQNCDSGSGGYEALTPIKPSLPPKDESFTSELDLQGTSSDGQVAYYVAPDDLPGTGAPATDALRPQLYVKAGAGSVRFVCILPSGNPTSQSCYAGTRSFSVGNRHSNLHNAVSANGSRVFWTSASERFGPGRIFMRDNAEQGAVPNECSSDEMPCTRAVSPIATGARFWGAADDGRAVVYAIEDGLSALNGNLYDFDASTGVSTLIAEKTLGVLGLSEDATRVYFSSSEVLGGENSEGDVAQPEAPNLYLHVVGTGTTFIGTLGAAEVHTNALLSPISTSPFDHAARVTPDGRHAAFISTAPLTGYDNLDADTGEPDTEVFLFDAEEAKLRCVSCNFTGARPQGKVFRKAAKGEPIGIAAKIPGFESVFHAPRVLSADGARLFFESHEGLVLRDANGVQDVYEWRQVSGRGDRGRADCAEIGADLFVDRAEGCISLISSGESPRGSFFVDADPDGANVFFETLSSLVPRDPGLIDIYDARMGGGFPSPAEPSECEGEACQSPPPPPVALTPASSTFRGKGNPKLRRCPRGKRRVVRRGKARCVKRKRRHSGRRAGHARRRVKR
jgi:hypothetical protein